MSIIINGQELNDLDCYFFASALRIGAKSWRQTAELSNSEYKDLMNERANKLDDWANKLTTEADSHGRFLVKKKKKVIDGPTNI